MFILLNNSDVKVMLSFQWALGLISRAPNLFCLTQRAKVLAGYHLKIWAYEYGATDGSLTVCHVSEPPSVIQQLKGHSKAITVDLLPVALPDDRVVEIQGEPTGVHKALELISNNLRKFVVDRGVLPLFENLQPDHKMQPSQPWGHPQGLPPNASGPGANISYIRRASGAAVTIQETRGMPGEMTVEIIGSATQVQTAQQLIQYIASSSVDKTVLVWEISKGHCIRVIYGTSSQLCIRFHPVNNNLLFVGNANKEINMINFSTGRVIKKVYFDKELTAMDNDHTGQLIFCGDSQRCIYTVSVNSHTGSISRSHKNRSMRSKSPITTVKYRTFFLVARCPVLVVCAQDDNLCFFSVALEIQGYLTLLCSLKLSPRRHSIRASFCPLLSLEKGEFIVAGSEDSNVYFYDLTRPKHACVNKLQGHGSPVIGVAWNHGENLLASSDSEGTVIVWKRAKTR